MGHESQGYVVSGHHFTIFVYGIQFCTYLLARSQNEKYT
jgi:hypothetical protein